MEVRPALLSMEERMGGLEEKNGQFLKCLFGSFSEYTNAQKIAVELKVYQS
jgi:hypothetical protein